MKPIYIDITNIPELNRYTGISRVVSEIAAEMNTDRIDLRLIAYSVENHAYRIVDSDRFQLAAKGLLRDKQRCYTGEFLNIDDIEEGSVFFDANSTWHTLPNRSWLLPKLKSRQIRIVTQIYDIIPIRFPQYMAASTLVRFMEYITAHMIYSDDIIVNSHAVENDVKQLFSEMDLPEKPIHVIGLGADFSDSKTADPNDFIDPEVEDALRGRRFLLTVGTVEPRKNQKVLVEAYEKYLADADTDVVIVGHVGWEMESFMERIINNPNYGKGLYCLTDCSDATLSYLYKHAFMVIFPSYTEGYGLPTIEAMINGVPVACSDIPVMREIGGKFCDYFDPDSPEQLYGIVKQYTEDKMLYNEKRRRLNDEYKPPKWRDTAKAMEKLMLEDKTSVPFPHKPVKQIVFLSARPEPLLATLPYIEEFMPFITELVVCCPGFMAEHMKQNYNGRLKLITITDDELLAGNQLPPDHSTRNFFLRCLAMQLDIIDDEFIMCDDDYRPLRPITEEVFYKDGKYIGYYFADISQWRYKISKLFSYDYCHFRTLAFLKKHGYPTLQYSAHQPQIINKRWYQEIIAKYPNIIRKGYDEWSTYFNYIAAEHRDQFKPVPYVTLSWPIIGGENKDVSQSDLIFENFYEDCYEPRKPFAGLSTVFTNKESICAETEKKVLISKKFKAERDEDAEFASDYAAEYEEIYHENPDVAVYFGSGKPFPELGVPAYMRLSKSLVNKVSIGVSRAPFCLANIATVIVEISVLDENMNVRFTKKVNMEPMLNHSYITYKLPQLPEGKFSFRVTAKLLTGDGGVAERIIPVEMFD